MDLGKKLRTVSVPKPVEAPMFNPVKVPEQVPDRELVPVKRDTIPQPLKELPI